MYKLTDSINKVIKQCLDYGSGEVCLLDGEKTVIFAEWEQWEDNNNYDVISISIYQAGINKFNYQVEETKIEAV